jgi:sialidase-1
VEAAPGRLVGLVRTEGDEASRAPSSQVGFLYQVTSQDGGLTWSRPVRTPLWGYPATLLRLRDGVLLASYGYRRAP